MEDKLLKQILDGPKQLDSFEDSLARRSYVFALLDSAMRQVFELDEVKKVLECIKDYIKETSDHDVNLINMAKNVIRCFWPKEEIAINFYDIEPFQYKYNEIDLKDEIHRKHCALRIAKGDRKKNLINNINLIEIRETYRILNESLTRDFVQAVRNENEGKMISLLKTIKLMSETMLSPGFKKRVLLRLLLKIKSSLAQSTNKEADILLDKPILKQADTMLLQWLSELVNSDPIKSNDKLTTYDAYLKPYWLNYRDEYISLQSQWSVDKTNHIILKQKRFNRSMKDFISKIAQDVCDLLPSPPESFCVVLYGSLARMEMTPFCDLQYSLLVNSHQHAEYFKQWIELFNLRIECIGETYLSDMNDRFGFHVDDYCHSKVEFMIATPEELAKALKNTILEHGNPCYIEKDRAYSHIFSDCFCGTDHGELWSTFREKTMAILAESYSDNQAVYRALGKKYLIKHRAELVPLIENQAFDVKTQMYDPIIHFISDLALYFNLVRPTILEILIALRERNHIDTTFCKALEKAYRVATSIRIKALNRAKGRPEREMVSFSDLTVEEKVGLIQINDGILKLLPRISERLSLCEVATLMRDRSSNSSELDFNVSFKNQSWTILESHNKSLEEDTTDGFTANTTLLSNLIGPEKKSLEKQPEKLRLLRNNLESVRSLLEGGLELNEIIEFKFLDRLLSHSDQVRFLLTSCKTKQVRFVPKDCVTWAGIKALKKKDPKKLDSIMNNLNAMIVLAKNGVMFDEIVNFTRKQNAFDNTFAFITNATENNNSCIEWSSDILKAIALNVDKMLHLQKAGLESTVILSLSATQLDMLIHILEKSENNDTVLAGLSVREIEHITSKKEEIVTQLTLGLQLQHIVWLTPTNINYGEATWRQLLYDFWVRSIQDEILRFIKNKDNESQHRVKQLHTLLDETLEIVKNNTEDLGLSVLQKVVALKKKCEKRKYIGKHRNIIGAFLKRIGCVLATAVSFGVAWRKSSRIRHGTLFHTGTQAKLLEAAKHLHEAIQQFNGLKSESSPLNLYNEIVRCP